MARFRWIVATAFALVALPQAAFAQAAGTVAGRVTAQESGAPLAGVEVVIQGTVRRSITDQQGEYRIGGVPVGTQRVDASLIGRSSANRTVTVTAGGTATANFALSSTAVELEGLVVNAVTGRTERKRELGTNTATIQVDEIAKGPISTVADVLTGRTAGVNLQGVTGSVGTSQRIRIRGANSLSLSNEPLIYVDGILFSNDKGGIGVGGQEFSRLNDIDPENIASVEILKGPAASSVYGTAAANGVILITTKKGRSGTPEWKVYAEGGTLTDRTDFPDNFLAYQINDPNAPLFLGADARFPGLFNGPTVARALGRDTAFVPCPNVIAATGACRQDAVVSFSPLNDSRISPFTTGSTGKVGASVSGGGDQVTYFLSADREDQTGVVDFNTYDRTNLRANVNAQLTDKLSVQVNTGYIKSNVVANSNDNSIFSPLINGLLGLPVLLDPAVDAATAPGDRPSFGFGFSPADIGNALTNQEIDRVLIGLQANYRPLSWLSANGNFGLDYFGRNDFQTVQPGRLPIGGSFELGRRLNDRSSSYNYTGSGSAVGVFDLSPNVVSTSTLGAQYTRELLEGNSCFGAGIIPGTASCGASSSLFAVDENFFEIKTIGGFFQQQFALNDRIFLAGSLRGDNNSAFGSDFGFIFYPSASLSWVVSEEPMFPRQLSFLSNLRLRAAIGTSGLRPDFRDAVTLFEPAAVQDNGAELSGVSLANIGDPDLEPEKTTEYEFGFDTGLLDERLSVEFTFYNKESSDALIRVPLAPSFGLSGDLTSGSAFANLATIRNRGIEAAVNAVAVENERVRLNLRASFTTLSNDILELGEGVEPIIFNRGNQRHQEGFPAGSFFQAGFKYNDADGNGLLSRGEVTIDSSTFIQVRNADGELETLTTAFQGEALPTNSQSISGDLTLFRYLTFTTLFERRAGNKQLNFTEGFRCRVGFGNANVTGAGGCSAVFNPDASLDEQAAFIANRFLGTQAGFIEDASFVKWRELSVTLGVPPTLSRNLRLLDGASLTLSGRNLHTWTDYTGLDPEINESGGNSNFTQGEFNTQPPVRYFTARLNFTF